MSYVLLVLAVLTTLMTIGLVTNVFRCYEPSLIERVGSVGIGVVMSVLLIIAHNGFIRQKTDLENIYKQGQKARKSGFNISDIPYKEPYLQEVYIDGYLGS